MPARSPGSVEGLGRSTAGSRTRARSGSRSMIADVGLTVVADLAGTDRAGADRAGAEATWSTLDAVIDGLGGGNEIAGGIWVRLVSVAALRSRALPRALNRLGLVAATAGLVTVVPGLSDVGRVFGLGLIVWFAGLGAVLLRTRDRARVPGDGGGRAGTPPPPRAPG